MQGASATLTPTSHLVLHLACTRVPLLQHHHELPGEGKAVESLDLEKALVPVRMPASCCQHARASVKVPLLDPSHFPHPIFPCTTQYRYGTSTMEALRTLWSQGGIPRFYQGLAPALIQGPLSRFGDTAANTGMMALLEDVDMPPAIKTIAASVGAGLFRILLMPVDACKTIMQVEGKNGLAALGNKIKVGGPLVLFDGALAASLATFVGHYPWFATVSVEMS
jgi:hypothetical protein